MFKFGTELCQTGQSLVTRCGSVQPRCQMQSWEENQEYQSSPLDLPRHDICKVFYVSAYTKMVNRGPRDAKSTNCPGFGDQLNGKTCYVPCATCGVFDICHI